MKMVSLQTAKAKLIHLGLNLAHLLIFLPHLLPPHQVSQLQRRVVNVKQKRYNNNYFFLSLNRIIAVLSKHMI